MNREIKFRGWFPGVKEMVYFDNAEYGWNKDGRVGMFIPSTSGKVYLESSIDTQYTGLKDANGKDIWEGDIISVDVLVSTEQEEIMGKKPKEDYVLGVVEFHKGCFIAMLVGDEGEKVGCEIEEDCIVLGNIYQDSELLK